MATPSTTIDAGGRSVKITNPEKLFFPEKGYTKLDLVNYYLAVGEGALRGVHRRPMVLKRYVDGAAGEPFFQKRAPTNRPEWVTTARIRFPSGRFADEVICDEIADLIWAVNLGCVDLNPWPVRETDVDHPDELRVDLDPTPEAGFAAVKQVALTVNEVLEELGYRGFPKTSGSRGVHVLVRIEPKWDFTQVRRSAIALGREVERRIPELATTAWWKEERHGVFIDYNQNARDRTVASAYSIRPTPDARVSYPLTWAELPDVELADFTIETAPRLFGERGDAHAEIDEVSYSLEPLLALVEKQEREGQGDAPWPPQFPKGEDEPARVQPSRARKPEGDATKKSTGRREPIHPLITVSQAEHKAEALQGLERWKAGHPGAAALLRPDDILVDSMRGRSATYTRIRVNLRNVSEAERPAQGTPDPDYDPWRDFEFPEGDPARGNTPPMRTTYRRPTRKNPADGRL
ncbi:MAG: DNA primase [Dehalococcoidia bacterium]|nr:DNA primase [Dehalococcoidia bacterium]